MGFLKRRFAASGGTCRRSPPCLTSQIKVATITSQPAKGRIDLSIGRIDGQ